MQLSYVLGLAVLAVTGRAQSATSSSSVSSTSASTRPTITSSSSSSSASASASSTSVSTVTIAVGAQGFLFSPNNVNASVGDIIEWRFYPGGHTVVRAEYEYPCIPYERTGINKVGFYSGEISPQVISSDLPAFRVRVNDTNPIFYYCSAPGSCYQQHMIGVINANATETFGTQMLFADNATSQLSPTDSWPSETVAATAAASASADSGSSSHKSLSGGAIAGIAIGGAAALVLIGFIIFMGGRRGGLKLAYRHSRAPSYPGGAVGAGGVGPTGAQMQFASPKSPGAATFSTAHYSDQTQQQHDSWRGVSPQPMSSGMSSNHSGYMQPHQQQQYAAYPPGMVVPGMHSPQQAVYGPVHPTPPPEPVPQQPPVELPTSADPGNSPLPQYLAPDQRPFAWNQTAEGAYRPSSNKP